MRDADARLEAELKRGILQIAVLTLLQEARYGYQLGRLLADAGLAVEEGTLYPILRRMEEQGLLESRWVTEKARPRKYYEATADGRDSLRALLEIWTRVDGALRRVLDASKEGGGAGGEGPPTAPPPPEETPHAP